MSLIALYQAKDWCGVEQNDPSHDHILTDVIAQAEGRFAEPGMLPVIQQTVTETIVGFQGWSKLLPYDRVVSIDAMTVRARFGEAVEIDDADYELEQCGPTLWAINLRAGFYATSRYTATLTAGPATLDPGVERVLSQMIRLEYAKRIDDTRLDQVQRAISRESGSATDAFDPSRLYAAWDDVIARFRRPWV